MSEQPSNSLVTTIGFASLLLGATVAISAGREDAQYERWEISSQDAERLSKEARAKALQICSKGGTGEVQALLLALINRPELQKVFIAGGAQHASGARLDIAFNEDQTCSVSLKTPELQCVDANADGVWESEVADVDQIERLQVDCNRALRAVLEEL